MDRFSEALAQVNSRYTYMERPRGTVQLQADVAIDALARLVMGLKDGQVRPHAVCRAALRCSVRCCAAWMVLCCAVHVLHPLLPLPPLFCPQPIPEEDAQLLEDCAAGGFWDTPGFREAAKRSIRERQQRASAYV